jgi:hypothetical protein
MLVIIHENPRIFLRRERYLAAGRLFMREILHIPSEVIIRTRYAGVSEIGNAIPNSSQIPASTLWIHRLWHFDWA